MEDKVILTSEGLQKMQEELKQLKTVDRIEVAKAIGEAKSYGDLSENSEYDAAKLKESQIEGRIFAIENMLKDVHLIDESSIDTTVVSIGCLVTVFDEEFDEENEYRILGANESSPENGKISNESPVGKALLGRKVGDVVQVVTPNNKYNLKIVKISI